MRVVINRMQSTCTCVASPPVCELCERSDLSACVPARALCSHTAGMWATGPPTHMPHAHVHVHVHVHVVCKLVRVCVTAQFVWLTIISASSRLRLAHYGLRARGDRVRAPPAPHAPGCGCPAPAGRGARAAAGAGGGAGGGPRTGHRHRARARSRGGTAGAARGVSNKRIGGTYYSGQYASPPADSRQTSDNGARTQRSSTKLSSK